MPSETALILRVTANGESFLKLDLLSPDRGALLCLKRVSRKAAQQTTPDLFDTAEVQLETSKQGSMRFVREYEVSVRRESIGRSYHSLRHASEYCALLARNAPQMAEPEALFELAQRSLDAFASGKAPEVVHLKSVYLLLKNEGYPIRESWWPDLAPATRSKAQELINSPAPAESDASLRETCEPILHQLYRWMERNTELSLP